MSDDIVERLRARLVKVHDLSGTGYGEDPLSAEAAATIIVQRARLEKAEEENKRLREALAPFDEFGRELSRRHYDKAQRIAFLVASTSFGPVEMALTFEAFLNLRAALERNDG